MQSEGIPFFGGYVKPLYLNPLYQEKLVFKHHLGKTNYSKGTCPITEDLHKKNLS